MSLPTAPGSKVRSRELDFVRGIAILMVMAFHFEQAPDNHPILRALQTPGKLIGQTGVDVFFVLSGFLVGGLLLKEYKQTGGLQAKQFLLRRGLKIWPAYYFFILVQVIVRKHPLNTFLVPNLLHLQNYLGTSILHTWTLSLEEHFYLILALAMAFMAGARWTSSRILKSFLCIMAAVIAIRCLTVYMGWPGATEYTHDRLDSLLFGVVLATLFHFYREWFDRIASKKWVLLSILVFAVCFHCLIRNESVRDSIGFTVLYFGYGALLLLAYRHSGRIRERFFYKWVANVGLYSYGIYLWHNSVRAPLLQLSIHYPEAIRWHLLMVSEYTAAILLGVATTFLVEWPFLRIRDRIFPTTKSSLNAPSRPISGESVSTPLSAFCPEKLPRALENI
jgi:peptidoglycan/LPS O-acetylase OafA/YrhL